MTVSLNYLIGFPQNDRNFNHAILVTVAEAQLNLVSQDIRHEVKLSHQSDCSFLANCWLVYNQLIHWFAVSTISGWKPSHTNTWMQMLNPSTSAKPFMTKHQNLFVVWVNINIFQIILLTNKCNLCCEHIFEYADMQNVCSVCTIWITIKLSWNFQ